MPLPALYNESISNKTWSHPYHCFPTFIWMSDVLGWLHPAKISPKRRASVHGPNVSDTPPGPLGVEPLEVVAATLPETAAGRVVEDPSPAQPHPPHLQKSMAQHPISHLRSPNSQPLAFYFLFVPDQLLPLHCNASGRAAARVARVAPLVATAADRVEAKPGPDTAWSHSVQRCGRCRGCS